MEKMKAQQRFWGSLVLILMFSGSGMSCNSGSNAEENKPAWIVEASNFLLGSQGWKGYEDFETFNKAADLEELFGFPVDDSEVLKGLTTVSDALSLLSSITSLFSGKNDSLLDDVKHDLVSDWKLSERYDVPKSLLDRDYTYLLKRNGKKGSRTYMAICAEGRRDRWTVISWKEKTRKKI